MNRELMDRKRNSHLDQHYLTEVLPQHPAEDLAKQDEVNTAAEDWLEEYLIQHPTPKET